MKKGAIVSRPHRIVQSGFLPEFFIRVSARSERMSERALSDLLY
jgi:hypothetical protein